MRANLSLTKALLLAMLLALPSGAWAQSSKATVKKNAAAPSPLSKVQAELKRGDLQAAEDALWPLLTANPNDKDAIALLGVIRARQTRYAEAESLFRRVVDLDPGSVQGHRNLAATLRVQDKLDAAIAELEATEKLAPQDVSLKLELAQAYTSTGQFPKVLSTLDKVPQRALPPEVVPLQVGALLSLRRKDEAVKLATQRAVSPAVAMDLAQLFLRAKHPAESLQVLNAAVKPGQALPARFHYLKGNALQGAGQTEAALASYRKALALEPKSGETLLAAAAVLSQKQKNEEALDFLQRARDLAPDAVPVLRLLVVEAERAGKATLAAQVARELAQKSPDNADDLNLAAAALLQVNDTAGAGPLLEKYVTMRSEDPRGWLGLGMAYIGQQRFPEARKSLERAIQLAPTFAEAEYQLGLAGISESNEQDALQHLEKARQLRPEHPQTLSRLGGIYLQEGDLEKSADVLQKSIELAPNDASTQYQLGLVLSKLGKTDEARQHLQRAEDLKQQANPRPPENSVRVPKK